MILSHRHRFIYIKTYKTASTAIEAALSAICGPDDVITPASEQLMKYRVNETAQNWRLDHPDVPKRKLWRRLLRRPERRYHPTVGYYEHMPGWRVRKYVGEDVWNGYYKFTFERNPWDRQVSWYYFKTKSKNERPSFAAFNRDKRKAWVENFDLYAINDEVALDFVGKWEMLEQDFPAVMERLGLQDSVTLPVANVSPDREKDYRSYYDESLKDLIAGWYRREIDYFGYEF